MKPFMPFYSLIKQKNGMPQPAPADTRKKDGQKKPPGSERWREVT